MRIAFRPIDTWPWLLYKKRAGIVQYVKLAAVMARAFRQSEMWPARIPPITPPKSKSVDRNVYATNFEKKRHNENEATPGILHASKNPTVSTSSEFDLKRDFFGDDINKSSSSSKPAPTDSGLTGKKK
ncbi:DNA gyrase subunit A [Striga asiatica]|uniref:DNA gyrase subunit A n=1 Tax=Striga asiatica TaxID=4170 RepID=A0A5A7QWQ3_STRAF|nr:DNA gyrase subunit A [Striga asiatica]